MLVFFSILYNPDVNALNNIRIAKSLGLHTVIYLNKSEDYFLKQLVGFDIVILGDNINVGLGKAFYEFEKYLQSTTYKYFIYFDQDTVVNDNAWHNIINTYESFYKNKEVGLLNYGNTPKINRHFVISSGSLFSMNILKEIGLHDKSYFVEGVDYEFCMRLFFSGYKIINMRCLGVDHKSLQDGFKVKLLCKNIFLRVYGKKRTNDFNIAHLRLLKIAIKKSNYKFTIFLLKSLIRHNIMELFSIIFSKFK